MRRMLLTTAAVVLAASSAAAVSSVGAVAQDELMIEGNVALVSDYRFRGVSLSDNTMALQGGFDLGLPSGFYVGTWGSSIDALTDSKGHTSELELDLYAGYGFSAGMFDFDVGALSYNYPGANEDLWYYELYGSVGTTFGMVDTSIDLHYSPDQDNLGDDSDTYVHGAASMPLGDSGWTLDGGLGYEDGVFGDLDGDGDNKWDWSLGVSTSFMGVDVGLSYIDTTESGELTEGVGVITISKSL